MAVISISHLQFGLGISGFDQKEVKAEVFTNDDNATPYLLGLRVTIYHHFMRHTLIFITLLGVVSFFACSSSDSDQVSRPIGQAPSYFGDPEIPDNNPSTKAGVELGRFLFYDERLSADNTISCGSCHRPELAFTDAKALSDGVNGQKSLRSSMSLANLMWATKLHWDGEFSSLEEQALSPIQNPLEMAQSLSEAERKLREAQIYHPMFASAFGDTAITAEKMGMALAQFIRSLISSDSKYDQYLRGEYEPSAQELRGIDLFTTHPEPAINLRGGNCGDCHLGPLTAGSTFEWQGFHNNGLDTDENLREGLYRITGNEGDKGKFKAPSLRNIALTAPYMHDGRFKTLEEVMDHYDQHIQMSSTLDPLIIEASNQIGAQAQLFLTDQEKEDIIAFLKMLTDESFITNPAYLKPSLLE